NAAKTSEEHLFEQFSPLKNAFTLPDVPNVSPMDDNTRIFSGAYDDDDDVGGQANLNNLETTMNVNSIPTTRINKDHPIELIIGDLHSAPLTRRMLQQNLEEHCLVSYINKQIRTNHKDYQNCLFSYFLSQKEPKKVIQALEDPSWIEAMQEELLQFELQKMDVKSPFLYGTNKEEVYVCQPLSFEDPHFPNNVYKVEKALYGLHQDPRACTPMEPNKAMVKDEEADNVDVYLYRSMIGSLMYLTASRPDITFTVYACARFQVTPKTSHLYAVKRIFRYLKGQPKLGLWYPRDSPFNLEAFSDSDYAGASLDRKSTIGAEYVVAASCCGQVLWMINQTLDYGFNFINTKINIDNESTICVMKNLKFHAKTKHIEISHHFIRDSYEKRLIQVIKVHSDQNVADLLIKASDVSRMVGRTYNIKRGQDTKIPQSGGPLVKVGDEAIYKELGDRMERAATTTSSLEAEQDSDAQTRLLRQAQHDCLLTKVIEGSEGFHQIIDFLTASNIKYALTENPSIYVSLIEQFWQIATASTLEDGDMSITATINGKVKVVSEASIRIHLKLEDSDGISTLSTAEIFEQLALMGYVSNSNRLAFQKGHFSP
ncbi:putative ribonuclease H-like domain-containing protein, partial [Tanacetum coccineum]